jgi:hypothetical protein
MEGKKERFKRLAEARTNKALAAIRSVAKLANRNHYEFNDEEAKAIFSAIRREVAEAQSAFSASCAKSEKKFKLD